MITIEVERVGDHTDSAHLTIAPGEVVKLTLTAYDNGKSPEARLSACTTYELAAEILRRLEA